MPLNKETKNKLKNLLIPIGVRNFEKALKGLEKKIGGGTRDDGKKTDYPDHSTVKFS